MSLSRRSRRCRDRLHESPPLPDESPPPLPDELPPPPPVVTVGDESPVLPPPLPSCEDGTVCVRLTLAEAAETGWGTVGIDSADVR